MPTVPCRVVQGLVMWTFVKAFRGCLLLQLPEEWAESELEYSILSGIQL